MPFLCTTIVRDGLEQDVTVHFSAECLSPGYAATWDDPGYPAEYETKFESAELDQPEIAGGTLTDAELATLRTWFVTNWDKAADAAAAANDNFADGPDPDVARDRKFDDRDFWRGLEA
jgi:hypothetical protein